jgi:transaldolase
LTRIFCDIADVNFIKKFNKKKIVKGFTTNPSLMRKAGAKNYSYYTKNILKITNKPVSCEVFADDVKNMIRQGVEISSWGKNVYVKVPVTNSKGKYMNEVIKTLNKKKIKLNITSVYNSRQTQKILKSIINKNTKVIISIFAGRMADAGKDPIPQFKESLKISKKFKNVEILWASTREPYNYLQAKRLGCQIITMPPSMIEKIEKFGKSYKKLTIETVKGFLVDTKKSKFTI